MQVSMGEVQTEFNSTIIKLLHFVGIEDTTSEFLFEEIYQGQVHEMNTFKEHVTDGKYDKSALRQVISENISLMQQIKQYRTALVCT